MYTGPIKVGMHFIWEPDRPWAWAHVVVTEIASHDSKGDPFDERRIHTRTIHATGANRAGQECWNEAGRFREACVPCDEHGVTVPEPTPSTPQSLA